MSNRTGRISMFESGFSPLGGGMSTLESGIVPYPSPVESPDALDNDDSEVKWGLLALTLFILSTAVGNILVCLAVCWERRLQNMTNYFLMSLAIADLLVAVLVMPLGLMVEMYHGEFPLGAQLCTLWATFDVGLCTASIWHMCTMSMDRYFTLKYPMKYGRNKTKNMVMLKIMFVWIVSIGICCPVLILGFVRPNSIYNERRCIPTSKNFIIYGSVFAFYIPLLIMVITYVLTTNILRNNSRLMRSMEQCRQQSLVMRKHYTPKHTAKYLSTNGYSVCEDVSNDSALHSRCLSENSGRGSISKSYSDIPEPYVRANDPLTLKVGIPAIMDVAKEDTCLMEEKPINCQNGHIGVTPMISLANSRSYLSIPVDHKKLSASLESLVSIHGTNVLNEPAEVQERLSMIEFEMEEYLSETSKTSEAGHTPRSGSSVSHLSQHGSMTGSKSHEQVSGPGAYRSLTPDPGTVSPFEPRDSCRGNSLAALAATNGADRDYDHSVGIRGSRVGSVNKDDRLSRVDSMRRQSAPAVPSLRIEVVDDPNVNQVNDLDHVTCTKFGLAGDNLNITLEEVGESSTDNLCEDNVNTVTVIEDDKPTLGTGLSLDDNENVQNVESESPKPEDYNVNKCDEYVNDQNYVNKQNGYAHEQNGYVNKEYGTEDSNDEYLNDEYSEVDYTNDEYTNDECANEDYTERGESPVCPECEKLNKEEEGRVGEKISTDETTDDHAEKTWLSPAARISQLRASSYTKIPSSDPDSGHDVTKIRHDVLHKSRSFNGLHPTQTLSYIEQCRRESGPANKRMSVRKARNLILRKAQRIPKRAANNEKKASKVLGIIFGVFVTLWTPFFIVNILMATCESCMSKVTPELMSTFLWFGWIASLANPIIYTAFNTTFRRAFLKILTCKYRRPRRRSSTPESLLMNTPTNWITTSGTRRDTVTVNMAT